MSTATATAPIHRPTRAPSRVGPVLRLHTVAWPLLVAWPVAIVGVSFAICWAIYFLVDNQEGEGFTGAVSALLGFVVAFYLQAMNQSFPFALGMSVTRRDFYRATLVMAVAQSAVFAAVVQGLAAIEDATGGWGVHMRMFGLARYLTDNPVVEYGFLFAVLLLTTGVAMLVGAIYQRWRTSGLLTAGVAVFAVAGIAVILVTWARWWPEIGSWFADTPRAVPMVALPLAVAVLALAGTWGALRRATP